MKGLGSTGLNAYEVTKVCLVDREKRLVPGMYISLELDNGELAREPLPSQVERSNIG